MVVSAIVVLDLSRYLQRDSYMANRSITMVILPAKRITHHVGRKRTK